MMHSLVASRCAVFLLKRKRQVMQIWWLWSLGLRFLFRHLYVLNKGFPTWHLMICSVPVCQVLPSCRLPESCTVLRDRVESTRRYILLHASHLLRKTSRIQSIYLSKIETTLTCLHLLTPGFKRSIKLYRAQNWPHHACFNLLCTGFQSVSELISRS